MISNCPPWLAISVVTRFRRTFSSRTIQLILLPVCFSHCVDNRCMMIMSLLLTVAILMVVASAPEQVALNAATDRIARVLIFIVFSPVYQPRGRIFESTTEKFRSRSNHVESFSATISSKIQQSGAFTGWYSPHPPSGSLHLPSPRRHSPDRAQPLRFPSAVRSVL